ncbi:MAG: hypothetical protein Ta2B_24500 [Termitinemataceae bacterium]|nr:MAG: hypothetical protein Ta2B_24500 [Termitinemataceae bacterium]
MKKLKLVMFLAATLFAVAVFSVGADTDKSLRPGQYSGITIQKVGNENSHSVIYIDPQCWEYNKKINAFVHKFNSGLFVVPSDTNVKQVGKTTSGWQIFRVYYK